MAFEKYKPRGLFSEFYGHKIFNERFVQLTIH